MLTCSSIVRGLGALVAEKFAGEGCTGIAINYVSNVKRAQATAEKIEKTYGTKPIVVQGVSTLAAEMLCWRVDAANGSCLGYGSTGRLPECGSG